MPSRSLRAEFRRQVIVSEPTVDTSAVRGGSDLFWRSLGTAVGLLGCLDPSDPAAGGRAGSSTSTRSRRPATSTPSSVAAKPARCRFPAYPQIVLLDVTDGDVVADESFII
jgi:hypothetical protein